MKRSSKEWPFLQGQANKLKNLSLIMTTFLCSCVFSCTSIGVISLSGVVPHNGVRFLHLYPRIFNQTTTPNPTLPKLLKLVPIFHSMQDQKGKRYFIRKSLLFTAMCRLNAGLSDQCHKLSHQLQCPVTKECPIWIIAHGNTLFPCSLYTYQVGKYEHLGKTYFNCEI